MVLSRSQQLFLTGPEMVLLRSQQLFLTGPEMVLPRSQHLFSTPVVHGLTEYGSCIYRNFANNDIMINTREDFSEHPEHFRSFVAFFFLHLIFIIKK